MNMIERIKRLLWKQAEAHPDGIVLTVASNERRPERHELTENQLQRIQRLQEVLAEPYPINLADWIAGFQADADPEKEIQIIESIAVTYRSATRGLSLAPEEKQSLYDRLCLLSCNPDHPPDCPVQKLAPQWDAIVELYREARRGRRRPQ